MSRKPSRQRCRWVLVRLPLLDGGELAGADRRKVESHLVGCPSCSARRSSLSGALAVMRASASAVPPALAGRPMAGSEGSLWPAIERQIRESRRAPARAVPWWEEWRSRIEARPLASSAIAAGLLTVAAAGVGVVSWASAERDTAGSAIQAAARPLPGVTTAPPRWVPRPALPRGEPGSSVASADAPVEAVPAASYGYDLDHGTPMDRDSGDVKASY